MPTKSSADWRIKVFPQSAIEGRRSDAFPVTDVLADVVSGKPSSWGGVSVRGAEGNHWGNWGRLGDDLILENVGYVNFQDDGSLSYDSRGKLIADSRGNPGTVGGFFALPARTPLAAAGSGFGSVADNAGDYADESIRWANQSGKFEAVSSLTSTGTSAIRNTSGSNTIDRASTVAPWEKGRGIHLNLSFTSMGGRGGSQGYFYARLSENLRLAFYQGQRPMLERRTMPKTGGVATAAWTVWKAMDGDVFDVLKRFYEVSLYTLANRLIWEINGKSQWMVEPELDPATLPPGAAPAGPERVADMSKFLGGIPLQVEAKNLRVRIEVARHDHTDAEGNPLPGKVTRKITRNNSINTVLPPSGVGHQPLGTGIITEVEAEGHTLTYTSTINPSSDGMFSPFLSRVHIGDVPEWLPTSGTGVDISAIIKRATVSHAHPPVQSGSCGSLTVDIALAREMMPGVRALLQDYCPVTIEARWRDEGGNIMGGYAPLFSGFIHGRGESQHTPNDAVDEITLHGMMMRLREPFAVVKDTPPLDTRYEERLNALDMASKKAAKDGFATVKDGVGEVAGARYMGDRGYYGCEAVQDIVGIFLGPVIFGRFNGNGDAKRYISPDRPPFIHVDDKEGSWLAVATSVGQSLTAGSFKSQSGGLLEPPWESDAYTWCENFAKDEYCLFTEMFTSRDGNGYPESFQTLAYGERTKLLAFAKFFYISASDIQWLLVDQIGADTQPEQDYNSILVLSTLGKTMPGAPAMIQGSARFHKDHPRSIEKTGERTKILHTELATTQEQAKDVAGIALLESDGSQSVFPKYHLTHGQANLLPGDVFHIKDSGDSTFTGGTFRASSVNHTWEQSEGRSWITDIALDIMSAREIATARRRLDWPLVDLG